MDKSDIDELAPYYALGLLAAKLAAARGDDDLNAAGKRYMEDALVHAREQLTALLEEGE